MAEPLSIDTILGSIVEPVFAEVPFTEPGRIHAVFTASFLARAANEGSLDLGSETFAQDALEVVRKSGNPLHVARAELVFTAHSAMADLVMQACRRARGLATGDLVSG